VRFVGLEPAPFRPEQAGASSSDDYASNSWNASIHAAIKRCDNRLFEINQRINSFEDMEFLM